MSEINASGDLHGHDLTDIWVPNPGDWFGKTWLIEIGGSTAEQLHVDRA